MSNFGHLVISNLVVEILCKDFLPCETTSKE
jgi:hypothetical protein